MDILLGETTTVNDKAMVYGPGSVAFDDPAELYHEASAFYRSRLAVQMAGAFALQTNPQLLISATRATKRYPHVESVELPAPAPATATLAESVSRRRSHLRFAGGSVSLAALSTLLQTGYGVTGRIGLDSGHDQCFRTAPSAGALYPLEVYVESFAIDGLQPGLYHYDPLAHGLERVLEGDRRDALAATLPMPEPVQTCAAAFVITAMMWRSRFKYGLRGYRFALLEAGHVAQNLLLAAQALGLGSVPVGGFFDRELATLLSLDAVNEAPLYVIPVGRPERAP
jgi:SagB-type dehydrogenase family enzyme